MNTYTKEEKPEIMFFTETQRFGARVIDTYSLEPYICDKLKELEDDSNLEFDPNLQQICAVVDSQNSISYQYKLLGLGEVVKITIDKSPIVNNVERYSTKIVSKICFVANLDDDDLVVSVASGIEGDENIVLSKGEIVMFPSFYSWVTVNETPRSFVLGNIVGEVFR